MKNKTYFIVKDGNLVAPKMLNAILESDGLYQVNGQKMIGQTADGKKVHLTVGRVSETTVIMTSEEYKTACQAARASKTEKIAGLKELENAISEKMNALSVQEERIAKADYRPVEFPETNIDELRNNYPMASAYLEAKNFSNSSNSDKRIAGKKAMKAIEDGGDYELAIAEMKAEWTKSAMENID